MAVFKEDKFSTVLSQHASQVLGVPQVAVPTDWMSLLMDLITGLFTGCLNQTPKPASDAPAAAPTTSTDIATQLKNANFIQRAQLRQRARKHYVQAGKTRRDGDNAYETMVSAVAATEVPDLAQAIDDARTDANVFPDFDLN
jgi:hypothetical protein